MKKIWDMCVITVVGHLWQLRRGDLLQLMLDAEAEENSGSLNLEMSLNEEESDGHVIQNDDHVTKETTITPAKSQRRLTHDVREYYIGALSSGHLLSRGRHTDLWGVQ